MSSEIPLLNTTLGSNELQWDTDSDRSTGLNPSPLTGSTEWFDKMFPELFPSIPRISDRVVDLGSSNPFEDGPGVRHPILRLSSFRQEVEVNGYIKFRFRMKDVEAKRPNNQKRIVYSKRELPLTARVPSLPLASGTPKIPAPDVPLNLGNSLEFDETDKKLMKFCPSLSILVTFHICRLLTLVQL
jgi:hypothetical protein